MSSMISYSVGYTAIDAAVTTVTITPPPGYSSGNQLIMGVIGGGTTGAAVSVTTPSGWTALSSGAEVGVFHKTAGSEPASYTITVSAIATIAVFIAAYPAATLINNAFHTSGTDITSYAPTFPSGVTSGETVLLIAAAVAASGDVNGNTGSQNVNLPATGSWVTEVPVFGQGLPNNTSNVYPCAIGMADIIGSTSTPTLASPQGCQIYAAYVVLNVTGTNSSQSVTATVEYPEGTPGLALTVKAITGVASISSIYNDAAYTYFYPGGTSTAPQTSITPYASNSLVYGAVTENFSVPASTSYTANAHTTFSQNVIDTSNSAIYGTFRSSSTTSAGTAITLGGSAPNNAYFTIALAEILAGTGDTLAEVATATAAGTFPANFSSTSVSQTAVLASAVSDTTLLVAMVSANSSWSNGSATVTIVDSLGLTWLVLAENHYPNYSGIWIGFSGSAPVGVNLPVARSALTAFPLSLAGTSAILDEASGNVLDEAGNNVYDESSVGGVTVNLPVARTTLAAYIPSNISNNAILDEAGNNVLDEAGNDVYDESGTSNTTVTLLTAQVLDVAYPLQPSTGIGGIWQRQSPTNVTPNDNYTVSAWIWTEQVNLTISIYWLSAGEVNNGVATQTVNIQPATWTFISLTTTAPSNAVSAYPALNVFGSGTSFYAEHVTLVNANAEVPYLPSLGLDYDNTYLQNVTQATLTQGPNTLISPVEKNQTSIASYLTRGPNAVTVNGSSAQDAYDVSYWYLAKYQQPQLRAASVTVDAATNPQSFSSVLRFDLNNVSTLNRHPVGAPPYSLPVVCEQVTHSIGPGMWQTSYQLSPYVQENTVLIPDGGAEEDTLGTSTLAW